MEVEAEVSLYPLGKRHLSRPTESFVKVLEEHECKAAVGPMSTVVYHNNEYDERLATAWGFGCLVEGLEMEVFMALGGFHLGGASAGHTRDIVKDMRELDVQVTAPCHCSGDRARRLFEKAYGENYHGAGVGWRLNVPPADNEVLSAE